MRYLIAVTCFLLLFSGCKNKEENNEVLVEKSVLIAKDPKPGIAGLEVDPVSHATAVLNWNGIIIYVDPVGGAKAFANKPEPDLILLTDIHGDHLDAETLGELNLEETQVLAPQAVKEQLPDSLNNYLTILNNGDSLETLGLSIKAIPMYNLRKEAKQFHPKGRGNGYVLARDDEKVYIAGDTEDIPEMRALEDIDVAFIPMNLPYTMPVENAADAVLDFAPELVYPYHYRGQDGMADIQEFKKLVNQGNKNIKVILVDWYPSRE